MELLHKNLMKSFILPFIFWNKTKKEDNLFECTANAHTVEINETIFTKKRKTLKKKNNYSLQMFSILVCLFFPLILLFLFIKFAFIKLKHIKNSSDSTHSFLFKMYFKKKERIWWWLTSVCTNFLRMFCHFQTQFI